MLTRGGIATGLRIVELLLAGLVGTGVEALIHGRTWSSAVVAIVLIAAAIAFTFGGEWIVYKWPFGRRFLLGRENVTGTWVDRAEHHETGEITYGLLFLSEDSQGVRGDCQDIGQNGELSRFNLSGRIDDDGVLVYNYDFRLKARVGRDRGVGRCEFGSDNGRRSYVGGFAELKALSTSRAVELTAPEAALVGRAPDKWAALGNMLPARNIPVWKPVAWSVPEEGTFERYRSITGETEQLAIDLSSLIAQHAKTGAKLRIFDFGGGAGKLAAKLSKDLEGRGTVVADIVSVDLSDQPRMYTVRGPAGESQECLRDDIARVSAALGPVDVVLFSHILAYVDQPIRLITSLERSGVGHPGALWIAVLPSQDSDQRAIARRALKAEVLSNPGDAARAEDHSGVLRELLTQRASPERVDDAPAGRDVRSVASVSVKKISAAELQTVVEFWLGRSVPSQEVRAELVADVVRDGDGYQLRIVSDVIYW